MCELQEFMWAYSSAGAAEACGGATGRPQIHDPPLVFDLQSDKAEETPLEVSTPEYQEVVEQITRRREELLWDIATDESVSTANYNTDKSAAPCCDPQQAICRCDTLGWRQGHFSRSGHAQIWSLHSSLRCPQLGVCRDATEDEQRQGEGGGSAFKLYGLVFDFF